MIHNAYIFAANRIAVVNRLELVYLCKVFVYTSSVLYSNSSFGEPRMGSAKCNPDRFVTRHGIKLIESKITELEGFITRLRETRDTARAHGDLSENSEYHDAKEQLRIREAELKEYSQTYRGHVFPVPNSTDVIRFGATVCCRKKNLSNKGEQGADVSQATEIKFTIGSKAEARLSEEFRYYGAGLPKAVIGKQVGDSIHFGDSEYIVDKIEYSYIASS